MAMHLRLVQVQEPEDHQDKEREAGSLEAVADGNSHGFSLSLHTVTQLPGISSKSRLRRLMFEAPADTESPIFVAAPEMVPTAAKQGSREVDDQSPNESYLCQNCTHDEKRTP
jgi:hypothetical protein